MKLALIGTQGHIDYYAPALKQLPSLKIAGLATTLPEENPERFRALPGVSATTPCYDNLHRLLDEQKPDAAQVCTRADLALQIVRACLERGIAVIAEKPLALHTDELKALYSLAKSVKASLSVLFGYRRFDAFQSAHAAILAGRIGEPLNATMQISYRWGKQRADSFKTRNTFAGIVPFMGIHALDLALWMLGDVFTEVRGWESTNAHLDYPACASQAQLQLRMKHGGILGLQLDFLRPWNAQQHQDDRIRIAGRKGIVEASTLNSFCQLLSEDEGELNLPAIAHAHWYALFLESVLHKTPSFASLEHIFRVHELAMLAQQSIDRDTSLSLLSTAFAPETDLTT